MGVAALAGGLAWLGRRGKAAPEDPDAPPQRAPLPPRNKLGKYVLGDIIADGGTATVYHATDDEGHHVAAKIPHADHLSSKEFVATFHREASIGETLRHPSIVAVLEVGQYKAGTHKKIPYFIMEYLEGQDLRSIIRSKGRLPPVEAARIARSIADALEWAHHRGVNHRDISPRNIFVTNRKTVKVMDFGISTVQSRITHKRTKGLTLGTPEYLAPERIDDPRSADSRSDLYSLGCVFFEMLHGHPPFVATSPVDVLRMHRKAKVPDPHPDLDIPPGMWTILLKLLEKDPKNRYQSAGAVTSALADLGTHF